MLRRVFVFQPTRTTRSRRGRQPAHRRRRATRRRPTTRAASRSQGVLVPVERHACGHARGQGRRRRGRAARARGLDARGRPARARPSRRRADHRPDDAEARREALAHAPAAADPRAIELGDGSASRVAATAPFGADVLERLAAQHEIAFLLTRPDAPRGPRPQGCAPTAGKAGRRAARHPRAPARAARRPLGRRVDASWSAPTAS